METTGWDKKHNCDLLSDLWKSQKSYSGLETNTACSHMSRAAQLRCLQLAEEKMQLLGISFLQPWHFFLLFTLEGRAFTHPQ